MQSKIKRSPRPPEVAELLIQDSLDNFEQTRKAIEVTDVKKNDEVQSPVAKEKESEDISEVKQQPGMFNNLFSRIGGIFSSNNVPTQSKDEPEEIK